MKLWCEKILSSTRRIAVPIMTHPGIDMIGRTVNDAVNNGTVHFQAIKALSDRFPSAAACTIMDLTQREFGDELLDFYVLQPMSKKTEIVYVPRNNEQILKRMRTILSPEEIHDLSGIKVDDLSKWIPNDRERQKKYKETLLYGSSEDLVQLIRTIYLHQIRMLEIGKKLHVQDERILKDAERILTEEVVYVMGISPEEALPLVCPINN